MDFLKSCATNVQSIDTTAFWHILYAPIPDDKDNNSNNNDNSTPQPNYPDILAAIAEFRQHCILASYHGNLIHIFGTLDAVPEVDLDAICRRVRFQPTSEETLEALPRRLALLKAVQGALSFSLGKEQGVARCGDWRWLFPAVDGEGAVEVRVEVALSEAGVLRLATVVEEKKTRGYEVAGRVPGASVLLAPFGTPAVVSVADAAAEGHQDAWCAMVASALRAEGLEIAEEECWIYVELQQDAEISRVLWPVHFCFAMDNAGVKAHNDKACWKQWFGIGSDESYRNPLTMAEEWHNKGPEREEALQTVSELPSHNPGTATGTTAASGQPVETPAELITSPPFTQRPEQQNVNGIYPTPPDGLIPGSAHAQLMSSETGPSVQADEQGPNDFPHSLEEPTDIRGRGHSLASSMGGHGYQGNTDDLFGEEMEDLEFGGDEIGDADFSFFDEPDDAPEGVADVLQSDVAHTNDTMNAGVKTSEVEPNLPDASGQIEPDVFLHVDDPDSKLLSELPEPPAQDEPLVPQGEQYHGDAVTKYEPYEPSRQPRPLSPFGIKERLLPPPIPASVQSVQQPGPSSVRRGSSFNPVEFRDDFKLNARYNDLPSFDPDVPPHDTGLALPPKRKKRHPEPAMKRSKTTEREESDSESHNDSYESASTASDDSLPPRMPWDTRKRKRSEAQTPLVGAMERTWPEETGQPERESFSPQRLVALLQTLVEGGQQSTTVVSRQEDSTMPTQAVTTVAPADTLTAEARLLKVARICNLSAQDVLCAAQVFAGQCTTITGNRALGTTFSDTRNSADQTAAFTTVRSMVSRLLPSANDLDLNKLAVAREAQPRLPPQKGQQRQPPRPEVLTGPEMFPFQPPHVRVQRASAHWEMLPSALPFWEALALEPANGPKNVRAYTIYPNNHDLQAVLLDFMNELGAAYEGSKLGSHVHRTDDNDPYVNGMVPVVLEEGETTLSKIIEAWAQTCTALARDLGEIACDESERTMVVYMIDPFGTFQSSHYLGACSWMLYKAYQETLKGNKEGECSDIVVQIIPIDSVASPETLVVPEPSYLASIAHKVYDQCPPSTAPDQNSVLTIAAAPAVELASSPPKKISFQLIADPPEDLLHEGSVMHVAYARSADGLWLTVAWTDNTGRYQNLTPFCLRGTSLAETITEVWRRTEDVIAGRRTSWRIFIVTTDALDDSVKRCWKEAITTRQRSQPFNVALLSADLDSSLTVSPPPVSDISISNQPASGAGFLTPATTPQGSSAFTVSPEASGHTNAPPTPAPSESAPPPALPENDPDAHLVDLTDESWGVLLDASTCNFKRATVKRGTTQSEQWQCTHLSHGALIKRGHSTQNLPLLGVNLFWSIRVSASGAGFNDATSVLESGLLLKQSLWMFRNLGLLGRVRGVRGAESGVVPWHVASVVAAAEGLDGFL